MTSDQRRLSALWPKVRGALPPPPATIVELGCGRLGGFVPTLQDDGYRPLGVDPVAPEGSSYIRAEFEASDLPVRVDAFVACTSLHHVAEPAVVLDKIANSLTAGGLVVVVEWDWESFDEATARWCFEQLGSEEPEDFLHCQRERWMASGQSWERYLRSWAEQHGLHPAATLLRELDRRFERLDCRRGAYFFPHLPNATEADELHAIDTGRIRAVRIDYVARLDHPRRSTGERSR